MKKAKNKFILYAVLSVFGLLVVILAIINAVNFTMVAEDADKITHMLSEAHGLFDKAPGRRPGELDNSFGPMGPSSPEIHASVRYFTVAFKDNGKAKVISFNISAVTEDEAVEWAEGLLKENTGWTRGTYRYRVYEDEELNRTCVIVIDQSRELLPSFRILIISAIGLVLGTLISLLILLYVGKQIFRPLDEADRKQKSFISKAEKSFKVPLTVISAETELLERAGGPNDHTRSINQQVRQMSSLVQTLGSFAVFEDTKKTRTRIALSEFLEAGLNEQAGAFAARNITLQREITPGIFLDANPDAIKQLLDELCDNALQYSLTRAVFRLTSENGRILLCTENDTTLPDGSLDQVFDRFTRLENAADTERSGLGLSYIKDIVKAHDGRAHAQVTNGVFVLTISL